MNTHGIRSTVAVTCFLVVNAAALAEFPTSRPFDGVTYRSEARSNPPQRLFIAEVDLTNPKVHVRVSPGGPDPDGPGEWETTLMPPTKVGAREGFDLVVNGDFFDIPKSKKAENRDPNLVLGEDWADAYGPAMTDGKTWSTFAKKLPCLVIRKDRKLSFEMVDVPPADAEAVVAGNRMMVEAGKAVEQVSKTRHPRTVVGLNRDRTKLVILVVDGRKKDAAVGMSYAELSREMLRLGCWDALNLDGGGSSVMALRDPATTEFKIVNTPSDGRERAVVNVLGVIAGHDDSQKHSTTSSQPPPG